MIHAAQEHAHDHELPPAAVLREHGKRLTAQRAAIWDVLAAKPDLHLSAEEVAARVKRRLSEVNPSTVYRTLDVLVGEGLVRRSDLGAGRAYFEPAHEHPHHHLVCTACGSVEHVHDDVLGDLAGRIEGSASFRLDDREITFFGTCGTRYRIGRSRMTDRTHDEVQAHEHVHAAGTVHTHAHGDQNQEHEHPEHSHEHAHAAGHENEHEHESKKGFLARFFGG
jgi:Fe2+ or Zn2+ uptake regulation protein